MVPPGVVYLKSISSAPGVAAAAKVWESAGWRCEDCDLMMMMMMMMMMMLSVSFLFLKFGLFFPFKSQSALPPCPGAYQP